MKEFAHHSPHTLAEALALLADSPAQGVVNAGGTDLMLQLRAGTRQPSTIINIKRLPELQGLDYEPECGLTLGSLTTLRELTRAPVIEEHYPCLAEAAGLMASEQIRSLATVGGNLCHGSPSADLAPPLIALGAEAVIVSVTGERRLPLERFFRGPGQTDLQAGELLRAIAIPPPVGRTVYLKQAPRAYMDIAVVGVAVNLQLDGEACRETRIVLGAVAPVPLRVPAAEAGLRGRMITQDRIEQAASAAAAACSPIDDVRGSAWYRRRLVAVLVRRALLSLTGRMDL